MQWQRVLAQADEAKWDEVFSGLLELWRVQRVASLAPLVDALGKAMESEAAGALRNIKTKKVPQNAWMALEAQGSIVDRGALLDTLTRGANAEIRERMKLVEAWEADPRTLVCLLGWFETLPFRSRSTQPIWNAAFRCLKTLQDSATLDEMRRFSKIKYAIGSGMQHWLSVSIQQMLTPLRKKAEEFPPDEPALQEFLASLQEKVASFTGVSFAQEEAAQPVDVLALLPTSFVPAEVSGLVLCGREESFPLMAGKFSWVRSNADGSLAAYRWESFTYLSSYGSERYHYDHTFIVRRADGAGLFESRGGLVALSDKGSYVAFSSSGHRSPSPVEVASTRAPYTRHSWALESIFDEVGLTGQLPEQKPWCGALAFSPDEKTFFVACGGYHEGFLFALDLASMQWSFLFKAKSIEGLRCSPDGRFLFVVGERQLYIYDFAWKMLRQAFSTGRINKLLPFAQGACFYIEREDSVLDEASNTYRYKLTPSVLRTGDAYPLANLEERDRKHLLFVDQEDRLGTLTYEDEGEETGFFVRDYMPSLDEDALACVVSAPAPLSLQPESKKNSILKKADWSDFRTDRGGTLCIRKDTRFGWWDLRSGEHLAAIDAYLPGVEGMALSADGKTIAAYVGASAFVLRDGAVVQAISEKKPIHAIAILPDGSGFFTSSSTSPKFYNLKHKRPKQTFKKHAYVARVLAVNAAGDRLLSGADDHAVALWTLDGKKEYTFLGHNEHVTGLAIHPGQQCFASGSTDGQIRVWSFAGGEALLSATCPRPRLSQLAFHPDGKRLFCLAEGRLFWWDLTSSTPPQEAQTGEAWLHAMAIDPASGWLVLSTAERSLLLWDPQKEALQTLLEQLWRPVDALAFCASSTLFVGGGCPEDTGSIARYKLQCQS